MKANQLVQKLGTKLLGKKVNTPAVGEYPGGVATVIQLAPDENAPEIEALRFNVEFVGRIGLLGLSS